MQQHLRVPASKGELATSLVRTCLLSGVPWQKDFSAANSRFRSFACLSAWPAEDKQERDGMRLWPELEPTAAHFT